MSWLDADQVRRLPVTAVLFADETDVEPTPFVGTLVDLLGVHERRETKRGTAAFSPCSYQVGATRGTEGVAQISALVFDFDHLSAHSYAALRTRLAEAAHVLYSSFSHLAGGLDDNCLRVLLPLSRPVSPADYRPLWSAMEDALGGLADQNARDVARLWYLPAAPASRADEAVVHFGGGRVTDVDALFDVEPPAADRDPVLPTNRRTGVDGAVNRGERNAFLMSFAGTLVRRGAAEETITAALIAENDARCRPPLAVAEVSGIVRSATRYDPASPLALAGLTDLGNAERLRHHAGDDILYCPEAGKWHVWDGRLWRIDRDGEVLRRAIEAIRRTALVAAQMDGDEGDPLREHAQGTRVIPCVSTRASQRAPRVCARW